VDAGIVTCVWTRAFEAVRALPPVYKDILASPTIESRVVRLAPNDSDQQLDDDYLDAMAGAFGK
jgi:hypothetical protein